MGVSSPNPAMKSKGGGMGMITGMRSMLPTRAGAANFMGGGLKETLGFFRSSMGGGVGPGNFSGAMKSWLSGGWVGAGMEEKIRSGAGRYMRSGQGSFKQGVAAGHLGVGLNRKLGLGGAALGLGMGISAVTGYSVFNQAQAVGAGYLGAKWAGRLGAGKMGMGAAAIGAGLGGQSMDWKQWGAAGAGYWGARGVQSILNSRAGGFRGGFGHGSITGRMGHGGGLGRAIGMGLGLGAEYMISNVL